MLNTEVCEGMEVVIRDWEDLASEYGLRENGDIPCPMTFIKDMRFLCGRTYTVKSVSYGAVYMFDTGDKESDKIMKYSISAAMLRRHEVEIPPETNAEDFDLDILIP